MFQSYENPTDTRITQNSGHAQVVSGFVDHHFFYASKLPYEAHWDCRYCDVIGHGHTAISAIRDALHFARALGILG